VLVIEPLLQRGAARAQLVVIFPPSQTNSQARRRCCCTHAPVHGNSLEKGHKLLGRKLLVLPGSRCARSTPARHVSAPSQQRGVGHARNLRAHAEVRRSTPSKTARRSRPLCEGRPAAPSGSCGMRRCSGVPAAWRRFRPRPRLPAAQGLHPGPRCSRPRPRQSDPARGSPRRPCYPRRLPPGCEGRRGSSPCPARAHLLLLMRNGTDFVADGRAGPALPARARPRPSAAPAPVPDRRDPPGPLRPLRSYPEAPPAPPSPRSDPFLCLIEDSRRRTNGAETRP